MVEDCDVIELIRFDLLMIKPRNVSQQVTVERFNDEQESAVKNAKADICKSHFGYLLCI